MTYCQAFPKYSDMYDYKHEKLCMLMNINWMNLIGGERGLLNTFCNHVEVHEFH